MDKSYKFRLYPTKMQEKALEMHRYISKTLWNYLLEYSINIYNKTGKFPTKSQLQSETKNKGMYSQSAQEVSHRLHKALLNCFVQRKKGKKAGFPRFKNIDRAKSIYYPQSGFALSKRKLKVTPFEEINITKHREMEGKIKTLALKRESSGKWFAIFVTENVDKPFISNNKEQVGIDLGLKTFATLSNGTKINNPRHLAKWEDMLAKRQKQLSTKKKGSKNRYKAKKQVSRIYEKIENTRTDFLHKISRQLINSYSMIAMEKLQSQDMAQQRYGKQINDAGWSKLANMLCYKAEEAGCRIIFVDPKGTSKTCHVCGNVQKMRLSERIYDCQSCGTIMDRDINASINILHKTTTVGQTGSNAWGNGHKEVPSLNQEAHTL